MYGKRAPWEDPSKWVLETYPWNPVSLPQEGPALLQLRPEDVGYEGCTSTKEATASKHIPQTDAEGDPLVSMACYSCFILQSVCSHWHLAIIIKDQLL